MRIEPNKPWSRTKGIEYFKKLIYGTEPFDLIKTRKKITIEQRGYFHIACQYIAALSGMTTIEVKYKIVKAVWCREIFYKRLDNGKEYCRSSEELSKEEYSLSIDRIIHFALIDLDIKVPDSKDYIIYQNEINGTIKDAEKRI